jgi:1,4-alpha-glucan branching enzyme
MPATGSRSFTGIKYHAITGNSGEKRIYDRTAALHKAAEHAQHFLETRMRQVEHLGGIMDRPPLILSPYDAELFGHWWYEGPEFLDYFVRKAVFDQQVFTLTTPLDYLRRQPTQQVSKPSPSSWGEEGYWKVWLNETNEWIYPHLRVAQERMSELADRFINPNEIELRALKQAARELLLAQSSDWPFILRTGTSPNYARKRVKDHLLRFIALHEQLTTTRVDEKWLGQIEAMDNLFPDVDYRYWTTRK